MDEKMVVITGASRGIGAAVAREFAAAGAALVLCARDVDALDGVAAELREAGATAEAVRGDVRDEFDMERVMERAARVGGAIDVVVPNAAVMHGFPGGSPLAEDSYSAFDDTVRTNLRGVYAAITEAEPHLAPDARVLVPSGSVAREAKPGMGAYAVSKAGAEALARQFAAELPQTVGVVDPGVVATDLTGGSGRDPAEVAGMYLWAVTELEAAALDGAVVGLAEWKRATR